MKTWANLIGKVFAGIWIFFASILAIAQIKNEIGESSFVQLWEFLKLVVGPMVGAGIAFYVNDYVHKKRKQEEELSAIFGAAYALAGMYSEFSIYRHSIRKQLGDVEKKYLDRQPPAPIFAYAMPHAFSFNENGFPDLSTLNFLLHIQEGRSAFARIQSVCRTARRLIDLHATFTNEVRSMQIKASESPDVNTKPIEEVLGTRTIAAVETLLVGIIRHLNYDGKYYEEAMKELKIATEKYFGRSISMKTPRVNNPEMQEENLPPLPKIFEPHVKQDI